MHLCYSDGFWSRRIEYDFINICPGPPTLQNPSPPKSVTMATSQETWLSFQTPGSVMYCKTSYCQSILLLYYRHFCNLSKFKVCSELDGSIWKLYRISKYMEIVHYDNAANKVMPPIYEDGSKFDVFTVHTSNLAVFSCQGSQVILLTTSRDSAVFWSWRTNYRVGQNRVPIYPVSNCTSVRCRRTVTNRVNRHSILAHPGIIWSRFWQNGRTAFQKI